MKRLAVLLLLLALGGGVEAQQVRKAHLFSKYDVDSGTLTYGYFSGTSGDAFAPGGMQGTALIETSGSSTTVTAVTAGAVPFALLGVGDSIHVRTAPDTVIIRFITAKASGDSITIDSAADLSAGDGMHFSWFKFNAGTAATSGWVDVSNLTNLTISLHYVQGDLGGGLNAVWECRVNEWDTQPTIVYPNEGDGCGASGTLGTSVCNFATAGATADLAVVIAGKWDACRLGVAFLTNDPSDAGANIELVSAELIGEVRR